MSAYQFLAFDIEANGFTPSEIFCICITDLITGEELDFGPDEIPEACVMLAEAKMVVGHYIRGYDCPVIERLTNNLIVFNRDCMIDTLDMSKSLTKNPKHSLKFWGNEFDFPKLEQPLFESYTPKMLIYCRRDVDITVRVFHHLVHHYIENDNSQFRNHEHLQCYFDALMAANPIGQSA